MDKQNILLRALFSSGHQQQIMLFFEEVAELEKNICHKIRNRGDADIIEKITEEIADVSIMLDQMKNIFGIKESEVQEWIGKKLARLDERLKYKEVKE